MGSQVPTWFYAVLVTILYFGYIFFGGLIFMILERPDEIRTCEEITKLAKTARRFQNEAAEMARKSNALIASSTEIDVSCAENDDSPQCIEISSSKKRAVRETSRKLVAFQEKRRFWEAKEFCEIQGMRLAQETDQAVLESQGFAEGESWLNPMVGMEKSCAKKGEKYILAVQTAIWPAEKTAEIKEENLESEVRNHIKRSLGKLGYGLGEITIGEDEEMSVSMRFDEAKSIEFPKTNIFEGFNPDQVRKLEEKNDECQVKLEKSILLLKEDDEKIAALEDHMTTFSKTITKMTEEIEKVEEKIHAVEVVKDNEVEEHKRDLINKQKLEEKLRMELRAKDYEIQALKSQIRAFENTMEIFGKMKSGANNMLNPSAVEMSNQLHSRISRPSDHPSEPDDPTAVNIRIEDEVHCPNIWNYRNAFFFTGTIGTTIGYGNVYPKTFYGKMFCIFYALTAIPIFGFVNYHVSCFIKARFEVIEQKVIGDSPTKAKKRLSYVLYLTFGVFILFILPAYGFSNLEGWSFSDAAYFTVISLTTVGFGDYTPSFEGAEETGIGFMSIYRILVLTWMLIGLAWLGSMLSLTSEKFGNFVKKVFDKALNVESHEILESDEEVISDDFLMDSKNEHLNISEQLSIPKGGDNMMPSPLMRRMNRNTLPNFENQGSNGNLDSPAITCWKKTAREDF
ncbi:Oidioi.mRNA.OKI2018_I69.chr1.g785.t1.cds [Oikopleura dioica]|uniref:Oidioi.mRNA.OKI2018_I69.chr1.g785.t1.cds n=1 Tax=Oikopleura dioica TaxID=34765 RepID=A0ABN7SPK0_OIKDI|nr:Oidioi.mRNA.OKI2018_I69.chr1.g785.t1.cds [Oikopleura dioica]